MQHILHVYRQIVAPVMGLKLRNQGTSEICETGELDSPGNSWAWGETESYAFIYSRTIVCANFRPRELRKAKLQFKFDFHSSCIDHSATSLSPCILYTLFSWYGKHWFTPSSDWMDFDSGTFAG